MIFKRHSNVLFVLIKILKNINIFSQCGIITKGSRATAANAKSIFNSFFSSRIKTPYKHELTG